MTPPPPEAVPARLEEEALARWRVRAAGGSEPAIRIEKRGSRYEITASSPDRSATLCLSARFVDKLLAGTGAACAGCADRFFDRLFERLSPSGEDQQPL